MRETAATWRSLPLSHDRAQLISGWDQSAVARGQVILCSTKREVGWDLLWLFAGSQGMGFRTVLACLGNGAAEEGAVGGWCREALAEDCVFVEPAPVVVEDELSLVRTLRADSPAVLVAAEADARTFVTTVALAQALGRPALLAVDNTKEIALIEVSPWTTSAQSLDGYVRLCGAGPRHPAISMLLAAAMLERARQIIAPLPIGDVPPRRHMLARTGVQHLRPRIEQPVYVIGAGGIGAPAAMLLANFASHLILIDHDIAEASNRARVPWLIPGEAKVLAVESFARFLADRMGAGALPTIETRVEKVVDGSFLASSTGPACVLAAVDNWGARALLSKVAVESARQERPVLLINAGCSPSGASVNPIGGEKGYGCLHHRHPALEELVAEEQGPSCGQLPAASILYTNWAAAALAVISLLNEPEAIAVEYSCSNPNRLHLRATLSCPCFEEAMVPEEEEPR